jgi:hypothetical protein
LSWPNFLLSFLSPCSVDGSLLMLMVKNKENREQRYKRVLQNAGVCLEARIWALLACYPPPRPPCRLSVHFHSLERSGLGAKKRELSGVRILPMRKVQLHFDKGWRLGCETQQGWILFGKNNIKHQQ